MHMGGVSTPSNQEKVILLQKYRDTNGSCILVLFKIGDFLAGALYREFRDFMRILTTFLGKTHKNPS